MGTLKALQEFQGHLNFPDGIYGCSVGSIFAIALAFHVPLDIMEKIYDESFSLDTIFPSLSLNQLQTMVDRKGLFRIQDSINKVMDAFKLYGYDIRNKLLSDAPQKVYLLSSNLTTGKRNLLTGNIPIYDALCCSCCIPLVFEPMVLYNQIQVDGGVFTRCIQSVVPSGTLVIHISGTGGKVNPDSSLGQILFCCYGGHRSQYQGDHIIRLQNNTVNILSNITAQQKQQMVHDGYTQTKEFLTKSVISSAVRLP
jgi:hypothetical protein